MKKLLFILAIIFQSFVVQSAQFKVVTLNCEWLSCTTNGPTDEELQINNIATVIAATGADIAALQEVGTSNSYATIDTLVKILGNEWAGNIVTWSRSNCRQNQGIVYKKSKVQLVSSSLVTNGGSSYYWSSGRYPALYNVNFLTENEVIPVSLINIHAKATSSASTDPVEDYNRRVGASEGLKTLLDGNTYNTKNVILLGDFNDYLVGTQCYSCTQTVSPYKNFMDDTGNYQGLTANLYSGNLIDNIVISNELFANYVPNSATREVAATQAVANYRYTTTDHYPISVLLKFNDASAVNPTFESNVGVYPNPSTGIVNFAQEVDVKVYNLQGLLLQQSVGNQIDLSAYPQGVYLLRVNGQSVKVLKK